MGVLAIPGYRMFKAWRAQNLAAEAVSLLEHADQLGEAWQKANSAYFLAPGNLDVVRAMAEVLEKGDPAQAIEYWEHAFELSEGAREDRLAIINNAILSNQLDVARDYLAPLNPEATRDLDVLELYGRFLGADGRYGEAMEMLDPVIQQIDVEESLHALYLALSQASRDPVLYQRGLGHVMELAKRGDAIGIKSLRLLIPLPDKTPAQQEFVNQRMEKHPLVERDDRIQWAEQKLVLGLDEPAAIVQDIGSQFNLQDPDELAAYSRWLNRIRQPSQVEGVIPLELALTRKDLFLILMDAYAYQGKWEAIQEVMEGKRIPLENYLKHIFMARTFLETGSERRAKLGWQKVRLEVANDPAKLQLYAQYTRQLGLYDEARLAYERLAELPISQGYGLQQRLEMERQLKNTEGIQETLEAMMFAYPLNDAVKNDLAYVNLLRGEDIDNSVVRARELIEKEPTFFAHKITLALGYFRSDQIEEALRVFDGFSVPYQSLSASWRVVFGTVLRANAQDDLADAVFRGIDARLLLPEELALFESYGPRPS